MHNVALRFVTCNISVDALSLLYSKNLCLFVFVAIFAEWNWQFISICSCFIRDYCLSVVKRT